MSSHKYGDVFTNIPPGLGAVYIPAGRGGGITVNPAGVSGGSSSSSPPAPVVTTLTNDAAGAGTYGLIENSPATGSVTLKSLAPGTGISLANPDTHSVSVVNAGVLTTTNDASTPNPFFSLVENPGIGAIVVKNLRAGTNITLTDSGNYLTVSAAAGGGGVSQISNDTTDAGSVGLVEGSPATGGVVLQGLLAGANVSLSTDGHSVTIAAANLWKVGGNTFTGSSVQPLGIISGSGVTLTIYSAGASALAFGASQAASFAGAGLFAGAVTSGIAGTNTGSLLIGATSGGSLTQTVNASMTQTYSVTWPATQAATANAVLTNDGSGILSWAVNPSNAWLVNGNTFTGTGIQSLGVTSGSGNTLTIYSAAAVALTFGASQAAAFAGTVTTGVAGTSTGSLLIAASGGGTLTQTVPPGLTSYSVTWPTAQAGAANAVLTNNGSGALNWTVNPSNGWLVSGNTFTGSGAQMLGVTSGSNVTLTIYSAASPALSFGSLLSAIFTGTVTSGIAGSITGSLIIAASGGGTLTQTVPSGLTSYSVIWPTTQATAASSALVNSGTGSLSWTQTWVVGGNAFTGSGTQTLGITAGLGNTLTIYSAAAVALTFGASQLATFAGTIAGNTTITAKSTITSGDGSANNGALIMQSTSAGALTQTVAPGMTAVYSLTWPTAAATSPSALVFDSTGAGNFRAPNISMGQLSSIFGTMSTSFTSTGLTATIQLHTSTSQVRILVTGTLGYSGGSSGTAFATILRNGADLSGGIGFVANQSPNTSNFTPCSMAWIDSPGGGTVTYAVAIKTSTGLVTAEWTGVTGFSSILSSIILEEIFS